MSQKDISSQNQSVQHNNTTRKSNSATIYTSVTLALSSFIFGVSLTAMDSINDIRSNEEASEGIIKTHVYLSDGKFSFFLSVICIGALITNIGINKVKMSLKKKLILNNFLYLVGTILITMMTNFYLLVMGRFIVGLGVGVTCALVPLYLNMIAPDNIRGLIGCLHGFGIVFGLLAGQILAYLFHDLKNWRNTFYFIITFIIVHTVLMLGIKSVDSVSVVKEEDVSIKRLLDCKSARKSLIIAILVHLTQQTSCINGVIFYSSEILKDTKDQRLSTIYVGIMSLISTTVALCIIDKFGRKIMLLLSCYIASIGLSLLAINVSPILSLFIFIAGFNVGLGPLPWMLTGEIFPDSYIKAGSTVAVSVNWITNFIIAMIFPSVLKVFGSQGFFVYVVMVLAASVYFLICFKETKGKVNDFQ
ncbi:hypothetical protein COBT_002203 [Conglomerata obtusa]